MIKRLLQSILIVSILGAILAIWRWWHIRKNRVAAPNAQNLIAQPDTALSLIRHGDTLSIQWQHPTQKADIYIGDAYRTLDESTPTLQVENRQVAMLHGIDTEQRYQVMVKFADGTILQHMERVLPFASAPNFRDIGGYQTQSGQVVRWNRVYRSSALDRLSPKDQVKLTQLGIQTVCDVRTQEEHFADPDNLPDGMQSISIAPSSDDNVLLAVIRLLFQQGFLENLLADLYQRVMIQDNPQVFAAIFTRLAKDANLPMVIHCAAGKDRTGITIALLLALLGVPDETIIADYAFSNHYYDFFKHATRKNLAQLRIIGLTESDFDYLLIADGMMLQDTLHQVRTQYGSIDNYLIQYVGLSQGTLDNIRQNMLI
ncbi:MAG: tyrosine-protein phosphatase [Phototrophicaceae bacterium]